MSALRIAAWAGLASAACAADLGPPSLVPRDYAASFLEVRPCRTSPDHDLGLVRVLASPDAAQAYLQRDRAFAPGAVILKEEYEPTGAGCSGPVRRWTVMAKRTAGSATVALDWHWQDVEADGQVVSDDEPRCYGCHASCGVAPDGHDGTCSAP